MPDLTPQRLPLLKEYRIPGLDLGENFVYPNYHGNSLLNVPPTICNLLDIPKIGHAPLDDEIFASFGGMAKVNAKNVIVILVDAMSLHRFRRWIHGGSVGIWKKLLENGVLAPITSVTPSTTSTCLPTLWSGLSPAEHGSVGYEMFLREYGTVANSITHTTFYVPGGKLINAGFEPETVLDTITIGEHTRRFGIQPHAFQHYTIANSGLSRLFFRDFDIHSFGGTSDLWVGVRKLFETTPEERKLVSVYFGQVDHLSHLYGPDDEYPAAAFESFSADFETFFYTRLAPELRKDTVVLLLADHGQTLTPTDPHYDLKNHPNLARRLHMQPTGENRLVYFYIRPGQTEAVREYLDRQFMGQFVQVEPGYAVENGLFGPGTPHPNLLDRMGDLAAFPGGNAYLWWGSKENPIIGRHGGLTEEEMVVPFAIMPL